MGVLELSGRDLVLEQDVEFTIGAAFGLGQAEEDPDRHEEARAGPEESRIGSPVPCGRSELVIGDDAADNAHGVVEVVLTR